MSATPIDIRQLTSQISLTEPQFDSDGQTLVWQERRGADAVLVSRQQGELADRDIDKVGDLKARVFYGGGTFTVSHGDVFYVRDGD
ncbi:MAG: hypothetical protein HOE86_04130, partial [Gemmatimonadetes bacterium]|nr:hypothetical protein [Gemmatimonadota bacterium]